MTKRLPSESQEQQKLVMKLRWNHPHVEFFSIPNGGKRNKSEARILTLEGVEEGVPDLFIAEPRQSFHGLFIEMKRADRAVSNISKVQKNKHTLYRARGYKVLVCYGCDEAYKEVLSYLQITV